MPSLEERSATFKAAAEWATSSSEATSTSNATKLELYGLYKYLTVAHAPNTKSPGMLDFAGRAKWNAWDKVSKEYSSEDAAEARYIAVVRSLGWKGSETTTPAEPKKPAGGGTSGMGVSVSAMARPPEDENAKEGEDSLHGAVLTGDALKVQAWLERNAAGPDVVDAKDEYGFTALHLAADRGYLPIVKALVSKGANVGIKDIDDLTAISLAQTAGHEDIVEYLESYLASKGSLGQGA